MADLSSHVALRAPELAVRLRVSRATAYRMLERLAGSQHREEALRLGTTVAPIGSGAKRKVLAVLWPVEAPP